MPALEVILEGILADLKDFSELRDKAIKSVRGIVSNSRRAINKILSNNLKEAHKIINELQNMSKELVEDLRSNPRLYNAGFLRDGLKEFVEAYLLYIYMSNTIDGEMSFPTPRELSVPEDTYIMGVFDFLGELKRVIINALRKKNFERAWRTLDFIKNILAILETETFVDAVVQGYKSRVDSLKKMVLSTEELLIKLENEEKLMEVAKFLTDNKIRK